MLAANDLRRVYCAGPLFNQAERDEMVQISDALKRHGFDTFVPHADGMEFALVQPEIVARGFRAERAGQMLHEAIFALDVYQVIGGCGSVVFNMNGRVPDEGAVAEATMAWMLGKPLVIYKEDRRSLIVGRDNPLVVGQARFTTVERIELLASALEEQIARVEEYGTLPTPPPAHLEPIVQAGACLWERMKAHGATPGFEARIAELIIHLFAIGECQEELATARVAAPVAVVSRGSVDGFEHRPLDGKAVSAADGRGRRN